MHTLTDEKWELLLSRLAATKCTPILGRGVASSAPPPGCDPAKWNFEYPINKAMTRRWAEAEGYPFADPESLDRVAQFITVKKDDPLAPKEFIQSVFACATPPDFACETAPHRILAELPIPVYLSTSYDDYLSQALARNPKRDHRMRLCHWSEKFAFDPDLHDPELPGATRPPQPTVANPLVYHFLGRADYPESLVLTEDDQFEFLLNLAREEQKLIGHWVQRSLKSVILFLGYTLQDRDFMLLFRLLSHFLKDSQMRHVAVQLEPDQLACADPERAIAHLARYFDDFKIDVYWGDCASFTAELWTRWKARPPSPAGP